MKGIAVLCAGKKHLEIWWDLSKNVIWNFAETLPPIYPQPVGGEDSIVISPCNQYIEDKLQVSSWVRILLYFALATSKLRNAKWGLGTIRTVQSAFSLYL